MMRKIPAVAAAGLALSLATTAQAADGKLFAEFKRFCLDTRAEPEKVIAAGKGWTVVDDYPAQYLFMLGMPFPTAKVWNSESGFLVASGRGLVQGQVTDSCTVSGEDPRVRDDLRKWAGTKLRPIGKDDAMGAIYLMLEDAEGLKSIGWDEANDPKNARRVIVLTVGGIAPEYILNLSRKAPVP